MTDEFDSDTDSDTDVQPLKSSFATLHWVNARKSVVTPKSKQCSLSPDADNADNASVHAASAPHSPSADLRPSPHPPVDDQDPAKLFIPKQDRSSTAVATPCSAVSTSSKRKDFSVTFGWEGEGEDKEDEGSKTSFECFPDSKGEGEEAEVNPGKDLGKACGGVCASHLCFMFVLQVQVQFHSNLLCNVISYSIVKIGN